MFYRNNFGVHGSILLLAAPLDSIYKFLRALISLIGSYMYLQNRKIVCFKNLDIHVYTCIYRIAGKFGKFGEFAGNRQIKTSPILSVALLRNAHAFISPNFKFAKINARQIFLL